ncbi:MAG: DUF1684 domain-containing protein [Chloroflexota bacterium]
MTEAIVSDFAPGDGSAGDRIWLADWRRRIAELYVEVRRLSVGDVERALTLWRDERERLFRGHPQSPVPPAARADFRARHFPHDPAVRFEVAVEPATDLTGTMGAFSGGAGLALPVSDGGEMRFARIGTIDLPFPEGSRRLGVYWMSGYAGGLFVPFRDATNGRETYGAGRYAIDAAKSADLGSDPAQGKIVVDFNFAFQPSCAFDPRWACPLAPPENRLDVEVRAGERLA